MKKSASRSRSSVRPLFVSTWRFGKDVNDRAVEVYSRTGSLLDAIEQGIRVAEADPENHSVGIGGIPNAEGVVQLDASIMFGPGHRAGSVAGVEGIAHPISLARRVMEKTPHVMLVGEGARAFALSEGLETVELLTERRRDEWLRWKSDRDRRQRSPNPEDRPSAESHDTITLLGFDSDDTLAGGCSTSGWGYKMPGRVGDSPIIGAGLYVDQRVGAAGATGAGENVMRYCATFLIVELMRRGAAPEEACVETIRRIAQQDPQGFDLDVNFIAIDNLGNHGAAGTREEFPYCVATPEESRVTIARRVGAGDE